MKVLKGKKGVCSTRARIPDVVVVVRVSRKEFNTKDARGSATYTQY